MKVIRYLIGLCRLPFDVILLTFHSVKGVIWLILMGCKRTLGKKASSWPFGCYTQMTPSGRCACLPGKKYGNIFMFRILCPDSARESMSCVGSFCSEQLQTKFSRWQPSVYRLLGVALFLMLTWSVVGYGLYRVLGPKNPIRSEKAQRLNALGQELVAKGENKKALIAFQKAIKHHPTNPDIHFHHGKCLLGLGRYQEALRAFGQASILNPDMGEAYLEIAKIAQKAGFRETSEKHARKACELNPNSTEAHLLLGSCLIKMGLLEEAEKSLNLAITLPHFSPEDSAVAGELYFYTKNLEKSEECFTKALAENPNSIGCLTGMAYIYIERGQWEIAEKQIEKILSEEPKSVMALSARAKLYSVKGEIQKAIEEYERLLDMKPDDPQIPFWLATLLIKTEEMDRGITILKKLLAEYPRSPEALTLLSKTYFHEKRFHLAAEAAQKILNLPNGNHAEARIILAKAYFEMGNYASAIDPLEKARKDFPNNFELTLRTAFAYQKTGEIEKAIISFKETISLNPKSSLPERYLGIIYEQKGQVDEAITYYQKSLKKNPEDRKLINQMVLLILKKNKEEKMELAFELASQNYSHEPENFYYAHTLALALYHRDEFAKAMELLEKVIAVEPFFPAAYFQLGKIYVKQDQNIKAKNALEKALRLSSSFQGAEEAKTLLIKLRQTDDVNLLNATPKEE